jgi:16S rRNA (guanine527-N7)-methyltransferase
VITTQEIRSQLKPYNIDAGTELCEAILRYVTLLLKWNKRISLTTITDPVEVVRFHFGESLFAASTVPIRGGRLADVGSGAGFPGLALGLADSSLSVTLIESNSRKATFLSEVVRDLKLDRVRVARARMDDLVSAETGVDFVTARALGQHHELLSWAKKMLSVDGRVILWLGEHDCATISGKSEWNWSAPIRIPGSKRRFLLVGSPKP